MIGSWQPAGSALPTWWTLKAPRHVNRLCLLLKVRRRWISARKNKQTIQSDKTADENNSNNSNKTCGANWCNPVVVSRFTSIPFGPLKSRSRKCSAPSHTRKTSLCLTKPSETRLEFFPDYLNPEQRDDNAIENSRIRSEDWLALASLQTCLGISRWSQFISKWLSEEIGRPETRRGGRFRSIARTPRPLVGNK